MRRTLMLPILLTLLALDITLTVGCLGVMVARRLLGVLGMLMLERQFDLVRASLSLSAWVAADDAKEAA